MRNCIRFFYCLPHIVAFVLIAVQGFTQDYLTLRVEVVGAKSNEGQAICGLFTSKKSFLKEPYRSETAVIDGQGKASFEFKSLKRGTYAVSVIYDENLDGKLNTGSLGIPTERFGASNNAKGRFGPPSFKKAKFVLNTEKKITISLTSAKE